MRNLKRADLWLALGALLLFSAHLRWGIGLLAWVVPVPFLRFLRVTSGRGSRLLFVASLSASWVLATLKIVTPPVPVVMALFFGGAIGGLQAFGYLGADGLRRRLGEQWGILAFPAVMTSIEWLQHRCTPLASWGAAAYTQLDDLPFLQIAAVGGMAAVSFLVYAVGASVESYASAHLNGTGPRLAGHFAFAAPVAVLLAHAFGAARMAQRLPSPARVAAIGTDATFHGEAPLSDAERATTLDGLFTATQAAADAGAKLAVWTEAAALVMPSEEDALADRLRAAAQHGRLHIVAAYIVPRSARPLAYENKYRWVRPDGAIDHTYFKHHPVPGEPAIAGRQPLAALETELGRAAGAICYDYDFPGLAQEQGSLGVDLIALPSSDWQGIDPIHAEMAALRAIEQGFSIVRSTRLGLTAAIDPLGRMRARQSSFETDERVVIAELPRRGIHTIYRALGDVTVYACMAFLVFALSRSALRK